jgi:hypothetical protein
MTLVAYWLLFRALEHTARGDYLAALIDYAIASALLATDTRKDHQ